MCRDGCANWESRRLLGVIHFLQADEILSYFAEEASSHVELFCCMTMHFCIVLGRHKPCCMINSIGTSSNILHTVRTWHRRTFSCFLKMEYLIGKHFANDEDLNDAGWITRRSHGMKRVYTNWCQGRTSMLMSEATYVPKHVYSISVLLLLKNILVWWHVLHFLDGPRIIMCSTVTKNWL